MAANTCIKSITRDDKKREITIVITEEKKHRLSGSGKNMLVATTGGNRETDLEIGGKALIVGINAYYAAE